MTEMKIDYDWNGNWLIDHVFYFWLKMKFKSHSLEDIVYFNNRL